MTLQKERKGAAHLPGAPRHRHRHRLVTVTVIPTATVMLLRAAQPAGTAPQPGDARGMWGRWGMLGGVLGCRGAGECQQSLRDGHPQPG